jgi:hypothetical protein
LASKLRIVLQEFLSLTKRPKQKEPLTKPQPTKASAASDSDMDSSEGSDDEVGIYSRHHTIKIPQQYIKLYHYIKVCHITTDQFE